MFFPSTQPSLRSSLLKASIRAFSLPIRKPMRFIPGGRTCCAQAASGSAPPKRPTKKRRLYREFKATLLLLQCEANLPRGVLTATAKHWIHRRVFLNLNTKDPIGKWPDGSRPAFRNGRNSLGRITPDPRKGAPERRASGR